jgi:protein-S-isoprenylcysteine O-methyltransferase Ste14
VARVLAWTGGVLFVASLLYTVYFYGVVLGDPTPAHTTSSLSLAVGINLVLFGLFAAHHSIFARGVTKRWIERIVPARMERSFYVWVASLLLIATWMLWRLVEGLLYDIDGFWKWPMYALQLAGVHLTVRAAGFLDALELAGIRQLQPRAREVVFRTDGPFGLVRHPIYLGWILMTFAAPAMTYNRLIFALITTGYLVVAIPWEERSLVTAFGDRYRTYQSLVKWRLIPGVW